MSAGTSGFSLGGLVQWLAGAAIVAGIGAAFVAYAAGSTADDAHKKAEVALEENDTQELKIQALEIKQTTIIEQNKSTGRKLDALLRSEGIDPASTD